MSDEAAAGDLDDDRVLVLRGTFEENGFTVSRIAKIAYSHIVGVELVVSAHYAPELCSSAIRILLIGGGTYDMQCSQARFDSICAALGWPNPPPGDDPSVA